MPNGIKLGGSAAKFEGNATPSQVLSGATFYSSDKELKTGSMVNQGAITQTLNAGGSYTIPAGYHNGSGKVTANSLASQTDGTATAAQILTGQTAYVDGVKVTGTMADQGAKTSSLNCGGSYTIPAGYHNGSGKVTANSLSSQTSATATASQILSGKTAWVNGSQITGTIASLGATTYTPSTSNQTIASGKYLSGTQTIKGDSNLVASNILSGKSIFGVSGNVVSGIQMEYYPVDATPSSSVGYFSGTTSYTYYWTSNKATMDYTNCIIYIGSTGHIIDVSGGVGTTFTFTTSNGGATLKGTITATGFTLAGTSIYYNAPTGWATQVTLIKIKNLKSLQIIGGTQTGREQIFSSGSYYTFRYYRTIEAVDISKSIVISSGMLTSTDNSYNKYSHPILVSSTKLQYAVVCDTNISSVRCDCAVIEFK